MSDAGAILVMRVREIATPIFLQRTAPTLKFAELVTLVYGNFPSLRLFAS